MLKVEHNMSKTQNLDTENGTNLKATNGYENTKYLIVKTGKDGISNITRVVEVEIPEELEHAVSSTKVLLTENASYLFSRGLFGLVKFGKWYVIQDFKSGVVDKHILNELEKTLDLDFIDLHRGYVFFTAKEGFEAEEDE